MWTGLTLRPFNARWAEHLTFNYMHIMDARLKMTLEYQFVVLLMFIFPYTKQKAFHETGTYSLSPTEILDELL